MSTTDETRLRELRARSEALFKTPYNQIAVRLEEDAARSSAQPAMRRDGNEQAIPTNATFNVFDIAHQETALDLSQALSMIAADQPGMNGLDAVLNAAEAAFATQNSDLVKFALGVFITNDPRGRTLYIPPAIEQSPELFIPSNVGVSPASPAMGGLGDEAKLDYFREDPDFNAHHLQWHRVYPTRGSLDPSNPGGGRIAKDRQGELFWYMHQQMLARYDTERIALDLPPVDALDDYTERLEGYRADENIADRYNGRPTHRRCRVQFGRRQPTGYRRHGGVARWAVAGRAHRKVRGARAAIDHDHTRCQGSHAVRCHARIEHRQGALTGCSFPPGRST
jgi:hypothetical protein